MTLSFLYSGEPGLGPLGPARLAFLVRQALGRVSAPVMAEAEVQHEVWLRRREVADRTTDMLEEYTEAEEVFLRRRQTATFVRVIGEALLLSGWLSLIVTVPLALAGEYSHSIFWWVAIALCVVASVGLRRSAGAMRRTALDGIVETYERLISRTVLDEIVSMVNEIVQREDERAKGALFYPMSAPTLVEFETAAVVDSASFAEVRALVEQHVTSAIGVAGTRGAGKSTLLRLLCETPKHVGVYLPAPTSATDQQFVKVIHSTTAKKVIDVRGRSDSTRRRWTPLRHRLKDDFVLAQKAVDRIERSTTRQRTGKMGMSRYGLTAEHSGQMTWTERERTRSDWVADFRQWAERHRLSSGLPIIVAIDELDKIADPTQAIEVINALKELFHIQGVHFVVSVSNDALTSFASRGVPVRDAFDTAFDAVIEVGRLTADKSYELLRQRQRRFPYPAALFCHAWSGGLPRDLVRTARSCVTLTNRSADPVPLAALVHRIIRHDVAETLDAAIRGDQERLSADALESLLVLRRALYDSSTPPHDVLRSRTPLDDAPASLKGYLDIAAAISAYYSISRGPEGWAQGINSGEFLRAADLLADAKAALDIHPGEAAWRLSVAQGELSRAETTHPID